MKVLFIIICITLSIESFSQKDFVFKNLNSRLPDSAILFNNYPNHIQLYFPNHRARNIIIDNNKDSINISFQEVVNDTLYLNLYIFYKGKQSLRIRDKKTNTIIKIIPYTTVVVNGMKAQIGNIRSQKVQKKILLLQKGINVKFDNPLYNYRFWVHSYIFKTNFNNTEIKVDGPLFTNDIIKTIKELPQNSLIEFTDIIAGGSDSRMRRLNNIQLIVY